MKNVKSIIVLVLCLALSLALISGVNIHTAPIIEANAGAAEFEPLYAVMPEAQGFEVIYTAGGETALVDVPETVQAIYSEASGLGYVIRLATTQGYTGEAIELTMAVDAEGKISGIELNAYPETKDFGAEYPATYLGQDSAMAEVSLVAGVTYSSAAFKNAVADGFNALIANALVGAGVKGDDQILTELVATVYPGMANAGIMQAEEIAADGTVKAFKALNAAGIAAIVESGDGMVLAICDVNGNTLVYNTEGAAVEDAAAAETARAVAEANLSSFADKDAAALGRLAGEGAVITEIEAPAAFNTVTTAFTVEMNGVTNYGFAARPYGYSNLPMEIYLILDAEGTIVAMNCPELIFFKEYFTTYTLDEPAYKAGFVGMTADTFTADSTLITGATMSANGVKSGISDIFATFSQLNVGGAA